MARPVLPACLSLLTSLVSIAAFATPPDSQTICAQTPTATHNLLLTPPVPFEGLTSLTIAFPALLTNAAPTVCLGDPASPNTWTNVELTQTAQGFRASWPDAALQPGGKVVRICSAATANANAPNTRCEDWPILPRPHFEPLALEGTKDFQVIFPAGPWLTAIGTGTFKIQAAAVHGGLKELLQAQDLNSATVTDLRLFFTARLPLARGDTILLAVTNRTNTWPDTFSTTVPGPLIDEAQVVLGAKTARVRFHLPLQASADSTTKVACRITAEHEPTLLALQEIKDGPTDIPLAASIDSSSHATLTLTVSNSKTILATETQKIEVRVPHLTLALPLKEGNATLTGSVSGGVTKLRIRQLASRVPDSSQVEAMGVADVTAAGHSFTYTFDEKAPLIEGQIVEVCPLVEDGSGVALEKACEQVVVRPSGLDWGRLAARFAIGTLLTQATPGTSGVLDKAAFYVALNVDNLIIDWLSHKTAAAALAFFEGRLTNTATGSQTKPAETSATPGAGASSTKGDTTTQTTTQSAAQLSLGVYLPIFLNENHTAFGQKYQGRRYGFSVGPIVKLGFLAVDGGYVTQYKTATDANGNVSLAIDDKGNPVAEKTSALAPFYSGGIRVGFSQLRDERDAAAAGRLRLVVALRKVKEAAKVEEAAAATSNHGGEEGTSLAQGTRTDAVKDELKKAEKLGWSVYGSQCDRDQEKAGCWQLRKKLMLLSDPTFNASRDLESVVEAVSGMKLPFQNRLPLLISYFDATIGRFDNYREPVALDPSHPTVLDGTRTMNRLVFEGRLKGPSLPLELGFEVNLRLNHADLQPHDYRIFVAVRADVTSAIKKAFGGVPQP